MPKTSTPSYRNVSRSPVDLASGRQLQPGEDSTIPPGEDGDLDPHDQAHIDLGRLREVATPQTAPATAPTPRAADHKE